MIGLFHKALFRCHEAYAILGGTRDNAAKARRARTGNDHMSTDGSNARQRATSRHRGSQVSAHTCRQHANMERSREEVV